MGLALDRITFTRLLAELIRKIESLGYQCYLGDVTATDGHKKDSFHYRGLAADINLFKDGVYLMKTEDHQIFGEYWKSLNPDCTWGGDFKNKDGNHYSFKEK